MSKRKRTTPTLHLQETSDQDTKSSVHVAKNVKKPLTEQKIVAQNHKRTRTATGDKVLKGDVAKQEKQSTARTVKKADNNLSFKLEKNEGDTEPGLQQRKKGPFPSNSNVKEKKSCSPSISTADQKPPSIGIKRASSDSKTSEAPKQAKVPKLRTDKTAKNEKSKTICDSHVSECSEKGKRKPKVASKSSVPPKQDKNDKRSTLPKAEDLSDPLAMLMMMEGRAGGVPGKTSSSLVSPLPSVKPSTCTPRALPSAKKKQISKFVDEDSSESEGLSDWEDVHDHAQSGSPKKSQVPDGPVEITLDLPDILKHKKRKKKEFDWKLYLERRVRRFKKEVAINKHKVHLLCLLSLGLRQNEELNDLTLSGLMISVMPSRLANVVSDMRSSALERRVEAVQAWYKKTFPLEQIKLCSNINLVLASKLEKCLSEGIITDARIWVLVFICILRTLGLSVRLVLSFHAVSYKASQETEKPTSSEKKQPKMKKVPSKPQVKSSNHVPSSSSSQPKSSPKISVKDKTPTSKDKVKFDKKETKVNRRRLSRTSSEKAKKNLKEADEESDTDDDVQDEKQPKSKKGKEKAVKPKTKSQKETSIIDDDFHGSESEFEETSSYFSSPSHLRKDLKILSNRKVLSANSSDDENYTINRSTIAGHDFWLEVYFPEKRRWICFDTFKCQFGKPYSLENSATQPLSYVVAFKNDGGVKDLTARYSKLWMSHTRKQRVDQTWWEDSLGPFNTTPHAANMEEDDEIKGKLLVRPIPTSIADLKNHPLYALRRHLLKFEAIYPDTAIPLGYIKQEPIYARECVRTLHSRDNWLKEGRMVRLAEQPYKMVKSRPKWNKPKDNPDELDLELYGEWQTEKYIPPPAVNGKVPKNEYGNIELFKPWMLPLGTVQLKVNGLQRIARKLGIDVAPAMIGWDHHSGRSHPLLDGVVVCEEFAETLMEAWTEDQDIQEQRETEKREKRVYGNWRLLIRGLLIKSRLTQKFSQVDLNVKDKRERLLKRVEELKKQEEIEEEKDFAKAERAGDVQQSWPRKQQDEYHERKVQDNKLKIEAAISLLEKGPKNKIEVVDIKADRVKNSTNDIGCTRLKVEGAKGGAFKTKNQIQDNFERAGKKIQTAKTRFKPIKQQKAKPTTKHTGKRKKSEEEETDTSDSEDNFEDEVGGESMTIKATSRPKRRSVGAVKYFDSGDEEAEDFIDDSDNDHDFEEEKERRKKVGKKRNLAKGNLLSDENDDGLRGKAKIFKRSPVTEKTEETRHWLDEEGSSSDENDFVAVEPEPTKDTSPDICETKEVVIVLNRDENSISEQEKSDIIDNESKSKTTNNEENHKSVHDDDKDMEKTTCNPDVFSGSKGSSIQETAVSEKTRQGRSKTTRAIKQADLSSKKDANEEISSEGGKETDGIGKNSNTCSTTGTKNQSKVLDSTNNNNLDRGESKGSVRVPNRRKNNGGTKETESKRKSLRITRQTS